MKSERSGHFIIVYAQSVSRKLSSQPKISWKRHINRGVIRTFSRKNSILKWNFMITSVKCFKNLISGQRCLHDTFHKFQSTLFSWNIYWNCFLSRQIWCTSAYYFSQSTLCPLTKLNVVDFEKLRWQEKNYKKHKIQVLACKKYTKTKNQKKIKSKCKTSDLLPLPGELQPLLQ